MAGKKERQRRLARQRLQRQQVKRAQRARRRRLGTIIAGACAVALGLGVAAFVTVGGGGKPAASASARPTSSPTSSPSSSATPTPSASATPTQVAEPAKHCTYISSPPAARKVGTPPATPDYKATYTATIHTNRGSIVIDLLNSKATCTVNSFAYLAGKDYYNNTPCPRVTTSGFFILQCGDPTGTGSGGPGYRFASENLKGATYPEGTLAMANTGAPDSNGSQFFIVYKNSSLPPTYTPFGRVVKGLNIVKNVAKAGYGPPVNSAGGGKPKKKVVIDSVTITKT